MSRKYQVTAPGPVAEQLEHLAAASEQPPTTVAGQFVRSEVVRAAADGTMRPLRQLPPTTGAVTTGARARWLEPYRGDPDWRADMWGQIVALHGRYPKALAWLQENGGPTRSYSRRCARLPHGARRSTTPASTREKSSPSPRSYAISHTSYGRQAEG
jgi:hypothetical protein